MDVTKKDLMRLQRVLDDSTFELLQAIATQMLVRMNTGTIEEETAYKTAVNAIKREERKRVMNIYFRQLEEMVGRVQSGD